MSPLKVAIFDDVVAARNEIFNIPGLLVNVYAHADNACALCASEQPYDVVFMDFAMGPGRASGAEAVTKLRATAFAGRIIGISSDPAANESMRNAGADDSLAKKAHLRSYLVHLGAQHKRGLPPLPAAAG